MAKSKAEVEQRVVVLAEAENPVVWVNVRKIGDGKISTGVHTNGGDMLYEEGETFSVRKDVADALIARQYVDEIPAPKAG